MSEPEFREVSEPTRLAASALTEDELQIVAGGNTTAISVSTPEGHPTQLNIWWKDDKTFVAPTYLPTVDEKDRKETAPWKLNGYIAPRDVAAEYMHRVHPNDS